MLLTNQKLDAITEQLATLLTIQQEPFCHLAKPELEPKQPYEWKGEEEIMPTLEDRIGSGHTTIGKKCSFVRMSLKVFQSIEADGMDAMLP